MVMKNDESDGDSSRIVAALQERLRADEAGGTLRPLGHYLELFPQDEKLVAREFLARRRDDRGGGDSESGMRWDGALERLGPYLLERELGRGGQGIVYRAQDTRLGRRVALKVLSQLGPGAEYQLERFRREAALASKLDHPGICGVHETGMEGGVPFIAMRYVEGETLAKRIAAQRDGAEGSTKGKAAESFLSFASEFPSSADGDGEFDFDSATLEPITEGGVAAGQGASSVTMSREQLRALLKIFEEVARALHATHEIGVLHRDIKPGNIMVDATGQPVILDFGLARDDSEEAGPSLTQTGDVFGTLAYMSPEQLSGRRVRLDRRSDVYSLGVTLFECITGRRPFESATREGLYQAVLTKEAPDPRRLNRAVPRDLAVIVTKAMEKDRDRRYDSALALAEDLAALREHRPILARPVGPLGRATRWARRRPALAALCLALAVGLPLATGLAGFAWATAPRLEERRQALVDDEVEELIEEAYFLFADGKSAEAERPFRKALELRPGRLEAAAGLAYVLLGKGKGHHDEALSLVDATEESAGRPGALEVPRIDIFRAMGREEEVKRREAALTPSDRADLWFLVGSGRIVAAQNIEGSTIFYGFRLGTEASDQVWDRALFNLRRAVAASSRPRRAYFLQLAVAVDRAGSAEEARRLAAAAEEIWPQSVTADRVAGLALQRHDRPRALKAWRRARVHEPHDLGILDRVATLTALEGEAEAAHALREEAVALKPEEPLVHLWLGTSWYDLGQPARARAAFEEAMRLGPPSVGMAHANIGNTYVAEGRLEEAEARFRAALAEDEHLCMPRSALASVLWETGRREEAMVEVQRALVDGPRYMTGRLNLAKYLATMGRLDEAEAELARVPVEGPHRVLRLNTEGSLAIIRKDWEAARSSFSLSLETGPEKPENLMGLGVATWRLGNPVKGLELVEKAIAQDADHPRPRFVRASILHDMGRGEEALEEIDRVLESSLTAEFVAARRVILYGLGRKDDAIAEARRVVEVAPTDEVAHVALHSLLADVGRHQESIECVSEEIRSERLGRFSVRLLESVLSRAGRRGEEAAILEAIVAESSDLWVARRQLADLAIRKSRFDVAEEHLQKAVATGRADASTHAQLAVLMTRTGRNQEALDLLSPLTERFASSPFIHNKLGAALYGLGRLGEALSEFEMAQSLAIKALRGANQTDVADLRTLADPGAVIQCAMNWAGALEKEGRITEAQAALRRAMDLAPDDAFLRGRFGELSRKAANSKPSKSEKEGVND
jgi:serine/threonine protein kinase/Tfp pilus assembly protein PilF